MIWATYCHRGWISVIHAGFSIHSLWLQQGSPSIFSRREICGFANASGALEPNANTIEFCMWGNKRRPAFSCQRKKIAKPSTSCPSFNLICVAYRLYRRERKDGPPCAQSGRQTKRCVDACQKIENDAFFDYNCVLLESSNRKQVSLILAIPSERKVESRLFIFLSFYSSSSVVFIFSCLDLLWVW